MARIKEREAGYTLPRLFVENVARFVRRLYGIMREVEIDNIVAARDVDLYSRQIGCLLALEGKETYIVHWFLFVQVVQAHRNMSRPQDS